MGTVGWAELLGVVEFDQFTSGKGNLVTGTFCHLAPETIDLVIEDIDPIGCTPNHPFWSVDRQDYISAGELVLNERVLLYNGDTKRVINKLSRPGPEFVYNLEVFGEHVYHVTTEGVLVHNTCASLDLKGRIGKNKSIPKQAYRVLNEFAKTGELPKNFCPAHKFVDKFKQLPKNGNYMTLDIIREYPNQRGVRRIVVDLLSGKAWYTNNHYETFRRM
jgi:guanyl-specific ribonuclease Sa